SRRRAVPEGGAMRSRAIVSVAMVLGLVAAGSAIGAPAGPGPLAFQISFASDVRDQPATGRVFVIVSRDSDPEPRFQVDVLGPPFWGKDVRDVAPGQTMVVGSGPGVVGYPLDSPVELPEGDYTVQAFLNVYTTFTRSDGSVVQLHMPCGDGGYFLDSPGNLYGTPVQLHLAPDSGTVELTLDKVIPPAEHVSAGQPRRLRARQAPEDPERPAHRVLGNADVPRRRRASARRLRRVVGNPVSGDLPARALSDGEPVRVRRGRVERVFDVVAVRARAEGDRRPAPAREPLLRRLLRGELGQPRAVRRRDRHRAHPRAAAPVPDGPQAVGAHAHGGLDRRLGGARPTGVRPELLRRDLAAVPGPGGLPLPPARQHLPGPERVRRRERLGDGAASVRAHGRRRHDLDDGAGEP